MADPVENDTRHRRKLIDCDRNTVKFVVATGVNVKPRVVYIDMKL